MNGRRRSLWLILLCLGVFTGMAGSARWFYFRQTGNQGTVDGQEEFLKLLAHYKAIRTNIAVSGRIRLFDGAVEKESASFSYIRKGDDTYAQLASLETIINGKRMLRIDTVHKIVSFFRSADMDKNLEGDPTLLLASLNDTANFKTDVKLMKGEKLHTLVIKSELIPDARQYSIEYDPASYNITGATIEWWKDPVNRKDPGKVWLSRIEYDGAGGPETKVPIRKTIPDVIRENGRDISLQPAYSAYQLDRSL